MQTYTIKFVLVGDSGVGKSQLLRRFAKKEFCSGSKSTINVEFSTRDVPFERCNIKAQIWDTVGQERFESLTKAYYRDAIGALLVYDITNKQSFQNVKNVWFNQLREYGHERLQIVLVGNKLDDDESESKREVDMHEALEFAKENGMDFAETSALSNSGVENVFRRMILGVAPAIPDINSHLGLTGLPDGWIHLSQTQARPAVAEEGINKIETVKTSADADEPLVGVADKGFDSTADYFMNYWTGEITRQIPSQVAETGMIYTVDPRSSVVSQSFYARGSLSMAGSRDDYDGIRLANEDEDAEFDLKKGKCYCNIL
jgi:Ras-related protein Rab-11A